MYDSMGRWGERGTAEESQCAEESAQRVVRVTCHAARRAPAHGTRACASRTLSHRFFVVCVCVTHTVRSCDCADFKLVSPPVTVARGEIFL